MRVEWFKSPHFIRKLVGRCTDRVLWSMSGNSSSFWNNHYRLGGTSGPGSRGALGDYKARFLNEFVASYSVNSVIEFGCGNGDQLTLARYPQYVGLDTSNVVIRDVAKRFQNDNTKSFFGYHPRAFFDYSSILCCDLALSIDVLFHIIEDDLYYLHLSQLFSAALQWVIIYSTNADDPKTDVPYTKHRRFVQDIPLSQGWNLVHTEANPHGELTRSEFFVFGKSVYRA